MRKLGEAALIGAIVYALTILLLPAVREVNAARAAPLATGRINVTATLAGQVSHALSPRGRRGNNVEQSWHITDSHGRHIGHMLLNCRWVLRQAMLCFGEITMPLGKIVVAGSSPTRFEGEYAVTGGTGVYRGAGGNMLFTAISLRKNVLLITVQR